MKRRGSILLNAPRALGSKITTNRLLKVIMTIIIICIITDLSLLKLYDLTPKNPYPRDRMIIFSSIAAVFIITQIFIMNYIRNQNTQFIRKRQFQVIHTTVAVLQGVLALILLRVILQLWFESSFDIDSVIVGITISYGLGMTMTGYLSYRFYVWGRSNYGTTILLYLLSSALITASSIFTLLFLDSVSSMYVEVNPRIRGTGIFLTQFQDTTLLLTNLLAIISFVVTWLATAVLLSYRSRYMGRTKYWVIVAVPLVYFLSQFIALFTSSFAPLTYGDPVVFGIVLTMIFTLSKLAGGILFGFAFWKMAGTISREFVVPRNLVRLAGYGYVILFMATQTVAFSIVPYPPFGFVTILFYGISSYMILIGVYFSVVVISQDSKLRRTIKHIAENQPGLVADLSYAQVENAIEKRAMSLAQRFAAELTSDSGVESSQDMDLKNYAMTVISEVKSYDRIYSKVMEKEKEILSNSLFVLACVDAKLLEYIRDDQLTLLNNVMNRHRKGTHQGLRLITSVDHSNVKVVEELLAMGIEIKHLSDMRSKQFVVSDTAMLEIPDSGKELDKRLQVEYNPTLVESYQDTFERLWKSTTDARKRILELKSHSI
jgi:hypothetical protein